MNCLHEAFSRRSSRLSLMFTQCCFLVLCTLAGNQSWLSYYSTSKPPTIVA